LRKSQRVGVEYVERCGQLGISGLSGGFVKKHKRLLLDAVVSYQANIADEKA
jgi:hypothetical protein